jgi:hypothetical protein
VKDRTIATLVAQDHKVHRGHKGRVVRRVRVVHLGLLVPPEAAALGVAEMVVVVEAPEGVGQEVVLTAVEVGAVAMAGEQVGELMVVVVVVEVDRRLR